VRNVNTTGQISNNNALNANAAAPDCVYSRLRVNRKIEIRAFRQGTVNLSRKGKQNSVDAGCSIEQVPLSQRRKGE
jgi:hypothetical protein